MNTHEFGEEVILEIEEEEKEPIFVKCSRCGEEVEVDSEDEEVEECDHCEDWIFCECCKAWKEPDGAEDVHNGSCRGHDTQTWCRSCIDDCAHWCEKCEEYFVDDLITVNGRRGNTKEMCESCADVHAWRCSDCEEYFLNDVDDRGYDDLYLCESCYENDHSYCDDCETHYRIGSNCECSQDRRRLGNRIKAYGDHGTFKKHQTFPGPLIGLEMEVGSFDRNNSDFMDEYEPNLGTDFAFPTRDGSLSRESGIEFIGHPRTALDHLNIWEDYEEFFRLLEVHEACLDLYPSGCHTNMKMLSDDQMRAATIAVERFRKALLLFTHPARLSQRSLYSSSEDKIQDDPQNWKTQKHHGATQLKRGDDLVEFRIAGMTLDIHRFHAQIQLYHNLWSWCREVQQNPWEAAYVPFDEIFLPTMFNNHIADVIEMGMSTGPLKVNVGSIDQPVPRRHRAA